MCVLISVFSYQKEQDLQPESVQALGPLPLVKVDDPPAAVLVLDVLPIGKDALLEQ